MKKILRYAFIAVLAFIANMAFGQAYKTLTFPDDDKATNGIGAYDKTWTAKIGKDTWSIVNFNNNNWNNNWKWIKCGGKKAAFVGTITTDFAIDKAISSVVVNIDKVTTASVNSIKLEVTSDKEGKKVLETVNLDKIATGDAVFTIKTPKENCYYKLLFDCDKGTGNGLITVVKVEYYKKGTGPDIVDISNTPETAYTVAKAKELIDAGKGLSTEVYVKVSSPVSEHSTPSTTAYHTIFQIMVKQPTNWKFTAENILAEKVSHLQTNSRLVMLLS